MKQPAGWDEYVQSLINAVCDAHNDDVTAQVSEQVPTNYNSDKE